MNKRNIIIFTVLLLICVIIFFDFLNMHYATDTYNIINRGYVEYAITYSLNDGRIFMCAITLIAGFINMPIKIYVVTLTFLSLIVSCISIMKLKNIVEKNKKTENLFKEIILIIICFTIIFNFMFLENMQFAETFVMSMSILLYIIGADILTSEEKNRFIKTCILVILGIFCYQGTLGSFVVMVFMFSIIKDKQKELLKNFIISGIICVIASATNLLQIKICGALLGMEQNRFGSIKNIFTMISYIISSLGYILVNTAGIFPKYMFIGILFSVVMIADICLHKDEKIIRVYIILLTIISIGVSFAINIFTSAGFGTGRMMFPIGALIGNIFLLLYSKTSIFEDKKKIMSFMVIGYFIIILINYVYIINKHSEVEKLTQNECRIIGEYIINYEKTTGNTVNKIAVYSDNKPTYYYNNIKNYSALCIRPLSVEWADNGSISYWCDKELEEIQPSKEIYEVYFKDKNWDELCQEQFIFIDDTMHYCIY